MHKSPESEIPAEFFAKTMKCSEHFAYNFADFRPLSSKKSGLHEKSSSNFTSHETKFCQGETQGARGANI